MKIHIEGTTVVITEGEARIELTPIEALLSGMQLMEQGTIAKAVENEEDEAAEVAAARKAFSTEDLA